MTEILKTLAKTEPTANVTGDALVAKLNALTAESLIRLLVSSLEHPAIPINLSSYLGFTTDLDSDGNKVIVINGCAATQMLFTLSEVVTGNNDKLVARYNRAALLGLDYYELGYIEAAVDALRRGDILSYNFYREGEECSRIHLPFIPFIPSAVSPDFTLIPGYTARNLAAFTAYADALAARS